MDQEGELFRQALQEEAVTLGIDPIQEQYLMHFAHKSLLSEPPEPWKELLDPASGHAYYLNSKTHESTWNNPATMIIRKQVDAARAIHIQGIERRKQQQQQQQQQ